MKTDKAYPYIENANDELRRLCEDRLKYAYGDSVPDKISERLNWEFDAISNTGVEFSFIFLRRLIEKLNLKPIDMNIRGTAGNSLVCFLLGITDIDPFQYNLSPYFMYGLNGNKEPDININLSERFLKKAASCYNDFDELAEAVWAYPNSDKQTVNIDEKTYATGLFLIPKIKNHINEPKTSTLFSEFNASSYDYDKFDSSFYKQNLLFYPILDILTELKDLTGVEPENLTFEEPEILSLFSSDFLDMHHIKFPDGTLNIIKKLKPQNFNDLVKAFGLMYGTGVWENNAGTLLEREDINLSDIISHRDDIFDYLKAEGVDEADAFNIAEEIGKGKWSSPRHKQKDEQIELLKDFNIPDWYIESCNKIGYLFPKAHSISYIKTLWRLGWYKIHYPEQYEASKEKCHIRST